MPTFAESSVPVDRKLARALFAQAGARLADARLGDRHVRIRGKRAVDQLRELRVAHAFPPACDRGLQGDRLIRAAECRSGALAARNTRRASIVGADDASGQECGENGPAKSLHQCIAICVSEEIGRRNSASGVVIAIATPSAKNKSL